MQLKEKWEASVHYFLSHLSEEELIAAGRGK